MSPSPPRQPFAYLLTLAVAIGLTFLTQHAWPAVCWLLGHGLIVFALHRLDQPTTTTTASSTSTKLLPALLAGASLAGFLLLLQYNTSASFGWRGFRHLANIAPRAWGFLLALLAPGIGCSLLALQQIQLLQRRIPERGPRLLLLTLSVLLFAASSLLPFVSTGYLPLAFSLGALLIGLDIYLEGERSSMTWLLMWLIVLSVVMASFAFRRSQQIDLQTHQLIAQDIARLGIPDTSRQYHMPILWDIIPTTEAPQQLLPEHLQLALGSGTQWVDGNLSSWVLRRANGQGFVMAGRNTGGSKPFWALASALFLVYLLYCLLLRALSWALAYPYERWLLPLFGPSSLRVRIQLSFFALVLVAFVLVGWATSGFFKNQPDWQDWLERLLSLYASLLVVGGVLGIALANSITEPIVKIGQKLSDTQLLGNQPLSWPKDDEIGRLVSNYNRMITDLNDSALKLAASEREGAWREMAKQVAHEIKNPLTPMKLQLQQLVRLEKEDPERAREWSRIVASRMIEQIDGLALIADEFSHFARLPEAHALRFDLRDLAHSAFELHRMNEQNIQLTLDNAPTPCTILADRDQLLRVANNLIRNAFQAIGSQSGGQVRIQCSCDGSQVTLLVQDNGPGIPTAIRDRIFQPNFTTKSSGMGLGLAMCRNIIQQAGGSISFETTLGEGTVFRVVLPSKE